MIGKGAALCLKIDLRPMTSTRVMDAAGTPQETSSLLKRLNGKLETEFKISLFSFLTFAAFRSWWVVLPWVFDDAAFLFMAFGALQLGVFTSDYFHTKYPPDVRIFHATFIVLATIGCAVNIKCDQKGCIIFAMAFIGLASNFSFLPQPRSESERRTYFYPVVLAWAGGFTYIVSASIYDDSEWKWVATYTLILLLAAFGLSFLLNFKRTKSSEEVAVWDSLEVMESSVFWIFIMYVALGITDAVYFSLAAYVLQHEFDMSLIDVAFFLGIAMVIPDTLLFFVRFCANRFKISSRLRVDSWKLRFIMAYLSYILFFSLIRFAPYALISVVSIQAVEFSRLAIRDIYRNTLIRTAEFAIPKLTFSRWVYTLNFLASCMVNFGIFRIYDWLPFVVGVGVLFIAFVRGVYDYLEDRGFYMEDDVISGAEGNSDGENSLNTEQETDKLDEALSYSLDPSMTADTTEEIHYVSLRHARHLEENTYI